MPQSWELRLATLLAAVNAVVLAGLLLAAAWSLTKDPDLLFAVYPAIAGAVFAVGAWLFAAALSHTQRLRRGEPGVRLQTLAVGLALMLLGFGLGLVVPWIGVVLLVHGGALTALVLTPAAARELGGFLDGASLVGPRRGRVAWREQRTEQAAEWWDVARRELSEGTLPSADVVLVAGALVAWLLMAVLLALQHGRFGVASGLLLVLGAGLLWSCWRRLRRRSLERGR
jgi:hypothetical protein